MAIDYVEYRKEICSKCEFKEKMVVIPGDMCKACGCSLLFKTALPMSECPERKWGKIDVTNNY